MEKREEVFYVRVRPGIKDWLQKRMKKDGWENMSDWFEQWIIRHQKREKKSDSRKK